MVSTGCELGSHSVRVDESRVASAGISLKGVIITGEPSSIGSDKKDLSLLPLRRTKTTIPIAASIATTPPATPPAIAGVSDFVSDDVFVFVVTLTFMLSTGALREGPSQP